MPSLSGPGRCQKGALPAAPVHTPDGWLGIFLLVPQAGSPSCCVQAFLPLQTPGGGQNRPPGGGEVAELYWIAVIAFK